MEIWEVEEGHLIALILEINRLGQSLLKFDEQEYKNYFSSRLAEITLSMLGLDGTSPEQPEGTSNGDAETKGNGINGFDAGPYSYLFNSEVFLNVNLIREILSGIRQNSEGFYNVKTQAFEIKSSTVWEIEERLIIDLIKYDYDIFNYNVGDATLKKFLDYKRKHQYEYRQIRAEQAKLGDKLYEPDAYDALYDEMIKLAKNKNI